MGKMEEVLSDEELASVKYQNLPAQKGENAVLLYNYTVTPPAAVRTNTHISPHLTTELPPSSFTASSLGENMSPANA